MKKILLLAFLATAIWACGSGDKPQQNTETKAEIPPPVTTAENPYPRLPPENGKLLFDSCDYVDIIFYYEDFSINQSNQSDIRGMLNYVSQDAPKSINPSCQPIGRIFFQIDGRNEAEADIHFQQDCLYFLFYKDGKKAYANGFTQSGVNFFNNVFAQVNTQKKATQQGQSQ